MKTDCASLRGSLLPHGPASRDALQSGVVPPQSRLRRLLGWIKRLAMVLVVLMAILWIAWLLLPKPSLYPEGMTFSRVVLDREGRVLYLTLTSDGKYRLPAHWAELAPDLIRATMEMEDRRYFSHHGADPRAVARAAWGVVSGRRLGGGSTLTMQYARLRWGMQTRSWPGKAAQMFRALQLERHYSKQELLEAYFTLAPYGGNVEGAPAASLLWCGKPASELSLREAAALSVIPQSPAARRPRPAVNASLSAAQGRLMARLREAQGEAVQTLDAEFCLHPAEPVPRFAPHYARRVLGEPAGAEVIRTTIDFTQQQIMEKSIADFLTRERARGLRNAAAVLVHAQTGEVRAYVGSANFFDEAIEGQVDGVTSRRSPGSALKPFIYALALDGGLMHPRTLLDDAPHRFAGYNPENSDRGFLGPLPAAEALRRSRNVPAVDLAARLPQGGLEAFLRGAGVELPRAHADYGLSLALGGAEVSLDDLARLYTGLARRAAGKSSGLATDGTEPLSPAACWLTLDALRGHEGPAGLAFKTGTSHGFRDAWACGVMGDWVLCVWMGNFDGKPMPGLFARETAAPLLFQTVTRLGLRGNIPARPEAITEVELCPISGELAGPHCPHGVKGPFIAGVSPITPCTVHREIILDAQGRRMAVEDGSGRREVREFWPAHRLEQFRRAGLPRAEPPLLAETTAGERAAAPRIVSPQQALTYVLRPGDSAKNSIPLEANAGAGVRQIYWFADARYLGASRPAQPFVWQPSPGRWRIQAVDDSGRSTAMTLRVVAE
jgi:penicillin-binding protein 1C